MNKDWAILKLETPLILNINVGPACLPSPGYLPMNTTKEECYVSGWGSLFQSKTSKVSFQFAIKVKKTLCVDGHSPDYLQYAKVPLMTNAECNSTYGHVNPITPNMACAGSPEGGNNTCPGM